MSCYNDITRLSWARPLEREITYSQESIYCQIESSMDFPLEYFSQSISFAKANRKIVRTYYWKELPYVYIFNRKIFLIWTHYYIWVSNWRRLLRLYFKKMFGSVATYVKFFNKLKYNIFYVIQYEHQTK